MTTADSRIFISYRRQETAWAARQLHEALCERYGASQVFKDVDNIAPGEDFVDKVTSTVASCQVLLAMIGPHWADATDEDGNRRLADPDDFVRLEVGTALSRGVLVVPILVDGAKMPKAVGLPPDVAGITRRQAVEISPTGFTLTRLFEALDQALAMPQVAADPWSPERADGPAPALDDLVQGESEPPAQAASDPARPGRSTFPLDPVVASMPSEPDPSVAERPVRGAPLPVLIGAGVVALVAVVLLVVQLLRPAGGVPAGPSTLTATPSQSASPGVTPTPSKPTPVAVSFFEAGFEVDATGVRFDIPVVCRPGWVLSVETTGELLSGDWPASGPNGAAGWFDPAASLPDAPLGALLATIGGSAPVFVGEVRTLVCWADGDLRFSVNVPTGGASGESAGGLTGVVRTHPGLETEADLVVSQVEVPATAPWVRSEFECVAGHHYRVSATGIANAEGGGPESAGGPDGVRPVDGKIVPGAVAKDFPKRGLLGRIGDGDPFLLGSSATLTCPADGPIEAQTNDGVLEDNVGGFSVTFSRWPDPPR